MLGVCDFPLGRYWMVSVRRAPTRHPIFGFEGKDTAFL